MNAHSMADVIVPKSDQINADDFIAGPQTITIREVKISGGQEQPVSIFMDGTDKAFRPCKSMCRVLVQVWGPDAKAYVGRSLTLYRDPTVKWGGLEVGGIRISHMSHIDGKLQMQLTATRGQRKPHIVMPLVVTQPSAPTASDSRGKAEKWLQGYLANPTDSEAVRKVLAKLQREYPDLYAQTQKPPPADDDYATDDQVDETDPRRVAADRLIALAKAGQVFSEKDAADLGALPDEMRAEVDAACATA